MPQYLLGYDLGSSSVKACLLDASNGTVAASATEPAVEMAIISPKPGWAEQDPVVWWENLVLATRRVLKESGVAPESVAAIGISYQMHGLVVVDKSLSVLRPAVIWCDSRAVGIGDKASRELDDDYVFGSLLNSPGNFTASKLKWTKENEPGVFERIYKVMLPGDYIALKMTGDVATTASGLSEGVMWDFKQQKLADRLLEYFGIDKNLVADVVPAFSVQGRLKADAAKELGLSAGTPLCYRAGDQPNNAFSLKALQPGDVAATAGTSGVVYAVVDKRVTDKQSRVNTFLHVNDGDGLDRLGVLLCVNGAGIMNSWVRNNVLQRRFTYNEMNALAALATVGAEGLSVLPFGNGAERMLGNRDLGASFHGLDLVRHQAAHLCRAVQEGIVFALAHGFEILRSLGIKPMVIRAGNSNMFQSEVFCETFANATNTELQLFNTDGAQGAARGAGVGLGLYKNTEEAFQRMRCIQQYEPRSPVQDQVLTAYGRWEGALKKQLETK